MTRIETIKGIIGVLWAMSVGLSAVICEYCSVFSELFYFFLLFFYIVQIAVIPYANNYLHKKIWYSATLLTLCVSNIFYCTFFAKGIVDALNNPTKLNDIFAAVVRGVLIAFYLIVFYKYILIFMIVFTIIIIVICIISYHKRKGSFH